MKASRVSFALALVLAGCGSSAAAPATPRPAAASRRVDDPEAQRARIRAFAEAEAHVVDVLASSDPRLAGRLRQVPSDDAVRALEKSALLAEDPDADVEARSLDVFSFAARRRALDDAKAALAKAAGDLADPPPPGSAIDRPALERELLVRVIDEELLRVKDESAIVPSASELVRGLTLAWPRGRTGVQWGDVDGWASRRLTQLRDAARADPARLPADLDDALSPLERELEPTTFPRTTAVMIDLRDLGGHARGNPATRGPLALLDAVHVHLHRTIDERTLVARVAAARAALHERVEAAIANASEDDKRELARLAGEALFTGASFPAVAGSRVRSFEPPPERRPVCGLLDALDATWGTPRAAVVLMAMHDAAVLAERELAAGEPPERAALYASFETVTIERVERFARARPLETIGVALAAELLLRDGAHARAHLAAWLAFGEAPLDVIERELFSQ